jgi:23S rRNA pseudouridine1911/1915/1917 synthase
MSQSHRFVVGSDEAPVRLDVFLRRRLTGVSRSYVQKAIDEGHATVGSRRRAKGYLLSPGDEIVLEGFVRPEDRALSPNASLVVPVVHEDADLLVLEKPAGMPVHPNDFDDTGTVVNFLLARYPEVIGVGEGVLRPGVVHRLDTGTTGLLLVARSARGYEGLKRQFVERTMRKHYLALAMGDVAAAGRVETPLAHDPTNVRKMKVVTNAVELESLKAREALTEYEPARSCGRATLLNVRIQTGRMHQIRVHLASIGHPLCGDPLYQSASQRSLDPSKLDRPGLHATRLELAHPTSGKPLVFESPLPADLAAACGRIAGEPTRR